MKFLAIDYGQKRIGLALSDDSETFALPFDTLERKSGKSNAQRLRQTVLEIIDREGVAGLVLGLPKTSSGEAGDMEERTRIFAGELQEDLRAAGSTLEITWWDERFSTASVLKNLRAAGITQKDARQAGGKESIDARAAAVILQDFLDARKLRAISPDAVHSPTESEDVF